MKIYYGKAVYDRKEIFAVNKTLKKNSLNLIDGPAVKKLEKIISKIFGKKYGLMVNSGSSANLLGLSSFNFKKGSEIITPTLTFSTTISPIYQLGLIPHFIDVEENKFIANVEHIEKCINRKTVAIMIPNLLGNLPDWKKIYLATAPLPWEWEKSLNNFIPISEASEKNIRETIESIQYIKLCYFHSLSDPAFPSLNWANTGLATWKILSKICVD